MFGIESSELAIVALVVTGVVILQRPLGTAERRDPVTASPGRPGRRVRQRKARVQRLGLEAGKGGLGARAADEVRPVGESACTGDRSLECGNSRAEVPGRPRALPNSRGVREGQVRTRTANDARGQGALAVE